MSQQEKEIVQIPVIYEVRQGAPEIGEIFTSKLCPPKKDGRDFTVRNVVNYTGYVKPNLRGDFTGELVEGRFYRFIVIAVHHKNYHNYFLCAPFREVKENENRHYNRISGENFLKIRRLAEELARTIEPQTPQPL